MTCSNPAGRYLVVDGMKSATSPGHPGHRDDIWIATGLPWRGPAARPRPDAYEGVWTVPSTSGEESRHRIERSTGASVTAAASRRYVGLRPFDIGDRDRFFGRTSESRAVYEQWSTSRLTVLYGPAGVGKTSLIQAGV